MFWIVAIRSASADDHPQYVGRSSCATATCHGGVIGLGPAWHSSSSVWESSDPHLRAGAVLLADLSRRIVGALEPAATDSDVAYYRALQTHCVSCHAPEAATELKSLDAALIAGVSCEACHGPASHWEKIHTLQGWNQSERFSASTGMLDMESPLSRVDNCVRCHVGSRTADALVRDMNHDMIAAGHPPLYFDAIRHHARLPTHWARAADKVTELQRSRAPETHEGLQARVLLAALRLSSERRVAGLAAPQPELSEYDCGACHHDLRINSPRQNRSTATALWQPWYTAGRELAVSRRDLHLSQTDLHKLHSTLEHSLLERSRSLIENMETDPRLHLEHLLADGLPDNRADYCSAAAWTDQIEAAQGRSVVQKQVDHLLISFRQRVLGFEKAEPTPLERLIPRQWEQHDLNSLRNELYHSIRPDSIAPEKRRGGR